MKKIGIFDVDYTITKKETLQELFKYLIYTDKKYLKYIPRSLYYGIMYLIKQYDEKMVKEKFLKFLHGMDEKKIEDIVKMFYKNRLSKIIYKDSIDMMKRLKAQGYEIYLISASPEFYLKELYNIEEVDKIIGTRFSFKEGIFEGKIIGENCKGVEKVYRLKKYLTENKITVNYHESYMFSDSMSDKPLLELVGNTYLINYKKESKYKILKWK